MTAQTDRLNTALAGRSRILRELGEGGMASAYLCEDLRHDRKVALKLLKPELGPANAFDPRVPPDRRLLAYLSNEGEGDAGLLLGPAPGRQALCVHGAGTGWGGTGSVFRPAELVRGASPGRGGRQVTACGRARGRDAGSRSALIETSSRTNASSGACIPPCVRRAAIRRSRR